jgi:REP element-mobilizing transposase RayT
VTTPPTHKFWHSRGYLPHCDTPGLLQSITYRLSDSLPDAVLNRLLHEECDEVNLIKRIEKYLDAGHGECWLRQPAAAKIVEDALLHGDGQRYRLLSWCVMPNHVHVLIETHSDYAIPKIVQGWKSYTAKRINQLLGRTGTVWMRDYFDRYIRDDQHLNAVIAYIHSNPIKAGLVLRSQDWLHSSARLAELNTGTAGVSPANADGTSALPHKTKLAIASDD